ncbi:MAG: hypothetical protein CVV24_01995 [Ignavibacteriae bacterium HGW-Ignavibacteriae-3]|nr:MAG: hypothetical protein CVV24_01995 [Ignavibacteriae bacterium HGW-Ignavibacteriae-3]
MKKILITLLVSLVPILEITIGQTIKLGIRIEPAMLISQTLDENSFSFTPFSFYANVLVQPIEWLSLDVRPGYLIGEEYRGYELGAFARLKISSSKFYIITGIINHSNTASSHNGGGSYAKDMLFKSVGVGFQKDSKLSFDVMYYWTGDKDYKYSRQTDFLTYSRTVNTQMNAILKVGFSLAWDIL